MSVTTVTAFTVYCKPTAPELITFNFFHRQHQNTVMVVTSKYYVVKYPDISDCVILSSSYFRNSPKTESYQIYSQGLRSVALRS